jgi:eukaryotic-like serine/threonine-protein kinase
VPVDPTIDLGQADGGPAAPAGGAPALPARYRDLGRLAAGGFGEVRRVEDLHLGAVLAMKVLRVEHAGDPDLRRRFLAEARLTARLQHPGIVAVQDLGELADGRAWYTMEIVRGRTLTEIVAELHRAWGEEGAEWTLRRVVAALASACQAVAAAHAEGVVHRDLKPDNVMIGAFGEVRVMDWGLARDLGAGEGPLSSGDAPAGAHSAVGRVVGTPAFMAPEQARGEAIGPTADVYSLGALLYAILTGRSPFPGDGRAAWLALLAGPPPDPLAVGRGELPLELVEVCRGAMARDHRERPADAAALARLLADWLEGARKRQEAELLVEEVRSRLPRAEQLRDRAARREAEAAEALAAVAPHQPVSAKRAGWKLEDEAAAARSEALHLEAELVRDLRAALVRAPELDSALTTLSDLTRARLEAAEARGQLDRVAELELELRAHDRGRHAAWLRGDGSFDLVSAPAGARVELLRFERIDRRLVPVPVGDLGRTPLRRRELPRGSYLLCIRGEGCEPVRYPLCLGRQERWTGVRPGSEEPTPIHLPPAGSLGPDDCVVPAGWFWSGGQEGAIDGTPRRRVWVDGLRARRFPVTCREYLAFLDEVPDEALWPRDPVSGEPLVLRGADGRFRLPLHPAEPQHPAHLDEPVSFVDHACARRFAAWEAARTGVPWRLPHELEWEKLARGVDGRAYPWGDHLDPSWTNMQLSHVGVPTRAVVGAFPEDESPYGVRGLGGNVRDWCSNPYRRGGLPAGLELVPREEADERAEFCMVRGGGIASAASNCLAAGRMAWNPAGRGGLVGCRLVADLLP